MSDKTTEPWIVHFSNGKFITHRSDGMWEMSNGVWTSNEWREVLRLANGAQITGAVDQNDR